MYFVLADVVLPFIGKVALNGWALFAFIACVTGVFAFEIVNGFHDTANAVATVIYTKSLKPYVAVVWSGLWNFLGVFIIGTAVAMSLVKLVPLERLITLPVAAGACLVIAVLLASILWNVSTWYMGIPLSSTHTLIGALIGGSLGFAHYYSGGVNWDKAKEIGLSLLISPVIGFAAAYLLIQMEKKLIHSKKWFHTPANDEDKPPLPVRIILVTTCTLVSFFHGSNDGQKGVGLLMLILITFLPARFMLNETLPASAVTSVLQTESQIMSEISPVTQDQKTAQDSLKYFIAEARQQAILLNAGNNNQRFQFRSKVQKLTVLLKKFLDEKKFTITSSQKDALDNNRKQLAKLTDFAPLWVITFISLALGLGTMIGWKRIVVTIGEKIGKEHLTYAQGATAEIVAAATIGLSTGFGLPVSTTHVLSSGVAGAMQASKNSQNLNMSTIRHIAYAWLLTLPVAIGLSFLLFVLFHLFV